MEFRHENRVLNACQQRSGTCGCDLDGFVAECNGTTLLRVAFTSGFALIKETDGAGNEENGPDALETWRSAA
jgi:hypothetical protein